MKILFKNVTTYSSNQYKNFLKFHSKQFNSYYKFNLIIIFLLFLVCIILSIKYNHLQLLILFILATFFYLFNNYIYPLKKVEKEFNSDKISKSQSLTFIFYKYHFKIIGNNQHTNLPYFKLFKVFETGDSFYLYPNINCSFVLSKESFKIGNSAQFSKFIHRKCLFKFKKA